METKFLLHNAVCLPVRVVHVCARAHKAVKYGHISVEL